MDDAVDHYLIMGLPSGEEGARLSEKEITKAYRKKALELHPDKRPDDSNALAEFQQLIASYALLKDEKGRKIFDDLIRIKHERVLRQSQQSSKRRKMRSDLEERERAAFAPDPETEAQEKEERTARELKEQIARIRAMYANKATSVFPTQRKEATAGVSESMNGVGGGVDKEKALKVFWEKVGVDYSAQRLRELFENFGEVEDVVIKSSKKKRCSAIVVMASKDAAVAATGNVCGDLSNPLLVLPVQPPITTTLPRPHQHVEPDDPKLSNLVGAGFKSFEGSVLNKMMQKAAEKRKSDGKPDEKPGGKSDGKL